MLKTIKNTVLGIGLALGLASATEAATVSMTLTNGQFTNFSGIIPGPLTVSQIIVTYTNQALVSFYDTPTNATTYTNAAYTNYTVYAINTTNVFTNYQGITQSNVFIALTNSPNVVAASTNNYPIRTQYGVTNGSVIGYPVNYYFVNGLWVSNSLTGGAGATAAVSITYQQ